MSDFLPDLRQVRVFVAIVRELSFTGAAKKLGLTQSAVSHSLRALEIQLGCQLIERGGKQVKPTREGNTFFKRSVHILDELGRAAHECDKMQHTGQSKLRIGAPTSLCQYLLPHALREFKDSFPQCELSIDTDDTAILLEKLRNHDLDLVYGLESTKTHGCHFKPLFTDDIYYVMIPSDPWASAEVITTKMIQERTLLLYSRATCTYAILEDFFQRMEIKEQGNWNIGDMEVIKQMAKAGLGIGLTALWIVAKEIEDGDLHARIILDNDQRPIRRNWGVFTPEVGVQSFVEEVFISICKMMGTSLSSPIIIN